MATSGLIPVVEQVVNDKVQVGEMFTAHDVTVECRRRGHKAYHNEVRDAVHDYYGRGGMGVAYSRTNISVPGGQPFLYHRTADDPTQYTGIRGGAPVLPANTTIPIPPVLGGSVSSTSDDDDDDDDDANQSVPIPSSLLSSYTQPSVAGVAVARRHNVNTGKLTARGVDGRHTLSLPAPLLRTAGFKPHQKVFVVATTDGVEVTDAQPQNGSVFGRYTVDSHTQVRITQAMLKRAGIGGDSYDVANAGNKVVVKLHK